MPLLSAWACGLCWLWGRLCLVLLRGAPLSVTLQKVQTVGNIRSQVALVSSHCTTMCTCVSVLQASGSLACPASRVAVSGVGSTAASQVKLLCRRPALNADSFDQCAAPACHLRFLSKQCSLC